MSKQLRVVMNRDERREREAELPSYIAVPATPGMPACILTHDGRSGGAWIGVNAYGLVACLLNHTPAAFADKPPLSGAVSRGVIVPALLAAGSRSAAAAGIAAYAQTDFAPWTVVLIDQEETLAWRWDGAQLRPHATQGPWVSSSLSDARVEAPRQQLWQRLVAPHPSPAAQDAWHASREGDDPAAWVAMAREDARSVSRTVVTVTAESVRLDHSPLDASGVAITTYQQRLPRREPSPRVV